MSKSPPPSSQTEVEEVGVYDAKSRLSELLDHVATGEEIIITKRGRPVARLVPATSNKPDASQVLAIFQDLDEASRGFRLTPDEARDAIREGRM